MSASSLKEVRLKSVLTGEEYNVMSMNSPGGDLAPPRGGGGEGE